MVFELSGSASPAGIGRRVPWLAPRTIELQLSLCRAYATARVAADRDRGGGDDGGRDWGMGDGGGLAAHLGVNRVCSTQHIIPPSLLAALSSPTPNNPTIYSSLCITQATTLYLIIKRLTTLRRKIIPQPGSGPS